MQKTIIRPPNPEHEKRIAEIYEFHKIVFNMAKLDIECDVSIKNSTFKKLEKKLDLSSQVCRSVRSIYYESRKVFEREKYKNKIIECVVIRKSHSDDIQIGVKVRNHPVQFYETKSEGLNVFY